MAYKDFPEDLQGQKKRKAFWLSEDGLTLIAGWRRWGITIEEIATKYIGISMTGFRNWCRESDELKRVLRQSQDVANMTAEESLLKRACGYDYVEQTYDLIEGELRLAHEYHRHMPPDTKALLAWLYNRCPEKWRSVQEPLEQTKYTETIKNILVAMKQVATNGETLQIEAKEDEQVPE